jgi:hypothetical protein
MDDHGPRTSLMNTSWIEERGVDTGDAARDLRSAAWRTRLDSG